MRCSINSERGELWNLLVLHMLKNFNIRVGKITSSNIFVCFSFFLCVQARGRCADVQAAEGYQAAA
jgi:hypothetical protein